MGQPELAWLGALPDTPRQPRRQHFRICHAEDAQSVQDRRLAAGGQETSPNLRGPDIYLSPRSGERPAAQPQAGDSAPDSSGNACADRIVVDTAHLPRACTLLQARHKLSLHSKGR